jgi:predicted ArsR family transcriptional regulator
MRGTATQRELCEAIGASRSTVSFHLNRLVIDGAVMRQPSRPEALYLVAQPEATRALLDRYHASLSAEDHARFALPAPQPAPSSALASG